MPTAFETTVYTTGDVARICQVAPRTVSKWFDTGRLKGYRIPGSLDRRIPRDSLIEFMRSHGMPLGELSTGTAGRVLLIGLTDQERTALERDLQIMGIEHQSAVSAFESGAAAVAFKPQCVVIDTALGSREAGAIARVLKQGQTPVRTIALMSDGAQPELWEPGWFDDRFRRPFDAALLAVRIRTLAEQVA